MQKYDDFDDRGAAGALSRIVNVLDRDGAIRARKPVFIVAIFGGLVALLAALLWYSYPRQSAHMDDVAAPIIRADAGPIKVEPDEPGGMDIPHRESTVFNSLRNENVSTKVESLLPQTEEPVDTDQMFAGLKTDLTDDMPPPPAAAVNDAPDEEAPMDLTETSDDEAKAQDAEVAEAVKLEEPKAPEAPAIEQKPEPVKAVEEAKAKVEPAAGVQEVKKEPAPISTAGGTHFVQLASIKSKAEGDKAWAALKKELPGKLDSRDFRVQEAAVAGKGTFYRIQAGPMSESEAKNLCDSIKAQKPGGCLVVRR